MKAIFRVDASLQIGTGHVMRCLTLADALAGAGASCEFICREHPGHLVDFIRRKGYVTHMLPMLDGATGPSLVQRSGSGTAHHKWLGATQHQDAEACTALLAENHPDWLIVDHYALDARWESALAPRIGRLMVIDDLADRKHACELLLDQTFGRDEQDYRGLVPADCHLLCGSRYALLRPEFPAMRPYSLQRRAQPLLRELLITMGGVDKDNATTQVLRALRWCSLPVDCRITVVMGQTSPHLETVRSEASGMALDTQVLVGVSNMAQLMAGSDFAIGAAGATSLERCCLGLPSLVLVLADNQRDIGQALHAAGAAWSVDLRLGVPDWISEQISLLVNDDSQLRNMGLRASEVTLGDGTRLVCDLMRLMAMENAS